MAAFLCKIIIKNLLNLKPKFYIEKLNFLHFTFRETQSFFNDT